MDGFASRSEKPEIPLEAMASVPKEELTKEQQAGKEFPYTDLKPRSN